jgi:hypothetical protein
MPRNFPKGEIRHARLQLETPGFVRTTAVTGARRRGQLYEERVHREFSQRYAGYLQSPWFHFYDEQGAKWCQPDGLVINPHKGLITIVEAKLRHTNDACCSLFGLYLPVVRSLFGGFYEFECVEVCHWYDPAVLCDRVPTLCAYPDNPRRGQFNVHIYDGR